VQQGNQPVFRTLTSYPNQAGRSDPKAVQVDGQMVQTPYRYPSPIDWRDCWTYFLMVDRFNHPSAAPRFDWNRKYGFRQGVSHLPSRDVRDLKKDGMPSGAARSRIIAYHGGSEFSPTAAPIILQELADEHRR
jgi:hypothetical protein